MSTKNNLQDALKNAFENHEVPLKEAQWERLEGVLLSNKPKRILFPFMFTFFLVCITAGLTYFLTLNYGMKSQESISESRNQSPSSPSLPDQNTNTSNSASNETTLLLNKTDLKNSKVAFSNSGLFTKVINSSIDKITKVINSVTLDSDKNESELEKDIPNTNEETEAPILFSEESIEPIQETIQEKEIDLVFDANDSANDKNDDNPLLMPYKPFSKFVLSFSAGYSNMNHKITEIENNQNLHKDSRMLFDQSNQNPNIFFINFGIDYNLFPGLNIGLNSGIQYLQINNPVNIKYKLNEIPLRDQDKIVGYIPLPDDQIKELNSNTTNTTTYINVPLRFNYTLPINIKNEVLLTGGANFSTIVSAKGKTIDVNDGEVKSLEKSRYNKLSTGFLGGVQYSHNLKNAWWLGTEAQWLSNKMNFVTGSGRINSKFQGYRVNLIIKYKL